MVKNNKKIEVLLGNEAIVQGALESGVDFVSTYPGCPSAEIGDEFEKIAKNYGGYFENSVNEKVALEAAIGASFSGLKSLVAMKNFGLNVCSEALLPLLYTGTKAPMVIVVGDDPNCWSSAQTEQNSRGYSLIAHLPTLEPADCQECLDFTKLAFEISEKFNLPVMVRTTIRVAHQRSPVEFSEAIKLESYKAPKIGKFVKNVHQYVTLPPRVLEMKKELLEKIVKLQKYLEKSATNYQINAKAQNKKLGIITSGVAHLHAMQALEQMDLNILVFKIGSFYPLPKENIKKFLKGLKKVLIIEELDGYIEKEIKTIAKDASLKIEIFGKNVLPEIGELNVELIENAIAKILNLPALLRKALQAGIKNIEIPRRTSRLCEGCPYWHVFPTLKRLAPEGTIFGGDIGCYMMAGLAPHNMQDYLFCMGSSLGIAHGIKKASKQKVISLIGDGTFFHSGVPALVNAVYNKSNPLVVILDNGITAMTGHQLNPGDSKRELSENYGDYAYDWSHSEAGSVSIKIEDVAKAVGVKNIKVLDPANTQEFESATKGFLEKDEISVIICRRMCALLAKKLSK